MALIRLVAIFYLILLLEDNAYSTAESHETAVASADDLSALTDDVMPPELDFHVGKGLELTHPLLLRMNLISPPK